MPLESGSQRHFGTFPPDPQYGKLPYSLTGLRVAEQVLGPLAANAGVLGQHTVGALSGTSRPGIEAAFDGSINNSTPVESGRVQAKPSRAPATRRGGA